MESAAARLALGIHIYLCVYSQRDCDELNDPLKDGLDQR